MISALCGLLVALLVPTHLLASEPNLPTSELLALSDLFYATTGYDWIYGDIPDAVVWNFTELNPNPCLEGWYGLTCVLVEDENVLHIGSMHLKGSNLFGTLPESFGNLTYLTVLDIQTNYIYSSLPSTFGSLSKLINVTIRQNDLTGSIPDSFWHLKNIHSFIADHNNFNGSITNSIGNFSCVYLNLFSNELTGSLPSEIGSLTNLTHLILSFNFFSNPLPDTIGNLQNLVHFEVENNRLNGPLPDSLYTLTSLNWLDLSVNRLSGNLSSSLETLTQLTIFDCSHNKLTGSVPDGLSKLTNLVSASLEFNEFTGRIPENVGDIQNLEYLLLDNNRLTNSIPDSVYTLGGLWTLSISYNELTGRVSEDIALMTSLRYLQISGNHFNGTIPNLSQNSRLLELSLDDNGFTGTLPDFLADLNRLDKLVLGTNQFQEGIPDSFCSFTSLSTMDVSFNQLTGTLPACIGAEGMPLLYLIVNDNYLYGTLPDSFYTFSEGLVGGFLLNNNLFSGTISNQITQLSTGIGDFQLGFNLFSGTIPNFLSECVHLVTLDLQYNKFTGTVPVVAAPYLEMFFINDNQFEGKLTDVLQYDADVTMFLINYDASNNQFSGPIPTTPFKIPGFQTFAAVSNCFTGSLPQEICGASSLLTLALDGLRSASSCQRRFFPSSTTIKSYWLDGEIEGGIPECVFQLPKLKILHLSGNGFSGSLPGSLSLASGNLTDLSLSNNNLKGSIPDELQRRQFSNLDLSYNKMGGTLSGDLFASYESGASLSLEVNRLSGEIPASLRNLEDVSVLDGNIFSCDADRTQIPRHDPDSRDYECGSNTFNYSMYVWIGVFGVLNLLCVFVMGVRGSDEVESESGGSSAGSSWMRPFDREDNKRGHGGVVELGLFLSQYRLLCSCIGVFIVVVGLPVNSVLSVYFNTYVYEYAWTVTSAYLSGVTPAVTLLLMVVLLFVVAGVALRSTILKLGDRTMLQWDKKTSRSWRQWFVILSVIVFDMVLMVGMNVAYVYIHSQYDSTIVQITQICVSLFKIAWNNIVIRLMLQLNKKFRGENVDRASSAIKTDVDASSLLNPRDSAVGGQVGSIAVGIGIMLFNNLAAPFIATAFVSSDCFYTVISTPPDVTVQYVYSDCVEYDQGAICSSYVFGTTVKTISYTPPFNYSYQCSSTFITTYVSIYVFMFIFIGFVAPAWKLLLLWLMNNTKKGNTVNSIVVNMLPRIMKPFEVTTAVPVSAGILEKPSGLFVLFDLPFTSERLFDCEVFVVQLANLLIVLVTFGLVVPAVAVVGVVTVYCVSYFTQWCIGRYVISARKSLTGTASLEALESDCEGAVVMLLRSLWLLVPFVVIFYSFLLFDILGDEEGWRKAIWMPVSIVGGLLVMWLLRKWRMYTVFGRWTRESRRSWGSDRRSELDEEAMEIDEKLLSN